jgi:hypothetical protein
MSFLWCEVCGTRPAMFNESRCEDCWASDQERYDQRRRVVNIRTTVKSSRDFDDANASLGKAMSCVRKSAPRE